MDRPILFQADMVRAILAGRKTQTRRALKVQPLDVLPMNEDPVNRWVTLDVRDPEDASKNHGSIIGCRYGKVGDRLWVREAWAPGAAGQIIYRADGDQLSLAAVKWRSPIHLKREHSRLTLALTRVRCERLQAITVDDARAEGIEDRHLARYAELWDRINGKRAGCAWQDNPFVWVLEFTPL
jgi:hypothetical protein